MATYQAAPIGDGAGNSTRHPDPGGERTLRILLLVVGLAVLAGVIPFLSGLVGSLILYVVARPVYDRLARKIPPRVAAIVVALAVFALLVLPGGWLISTIINEGRTALQSWNPSRLSELLANTPLRNLDIASRLEGAETSIIGWLSGRAFAFFGSAAATTLNIAIAFFGLYYLLLSGPSFWARIVRVVPLPEHVTHTLAKRFVDVTDALLLGIGLTAVLQGTLIGIGFQIVGLQPAVLWGFVTACVSVLPLFGSALVWLPGALILLLTHRPGAAVFLLVLGGGIAANLDNLIRPLIYQRVSGIHPMVTFVGAFAGVHIFGIIGALLGPLFLSYFFELLNAYEQATRPSEA